MKAWIKRWLPVGLALGLVWVVGTAVVQAQNGPRMRLVNASPAGTGDIYLDGNMLYRGIAFGTITDYQPLAAGNHVIRVLPAGLSTPLLSEVTLPFADGKDYTVIVVGGRQDNIQVWQLEDNNAPDNNRARVRVIHTSPDAGRLDICVNGNCQVTGLDYKNASGYQNLDPGTYNVEARRAGTSEVIHAANFRFDRGVVYSVIGLGLAQGDPRFQLVLRPDAGRPPTQPPVTGALLSPAAILVLGIVIVLLFGGWWVVRRLGQG